MTVLAAAAGRGWLGLWLAPTAALAAAEAAKAWRSRGEQAQPGAAAGITAAMCLAAIWGAPAMVVVALVGGAALVGAGAIPSLAGKQGAAPAPSGRGIAHTLCVALPLGLAGGAPVLLRGVDLARPLILLAYAFAYDAGAYLVGTGSSALWEGPAAGIVAFIPVTLMAAALLVPPYRIGAVLAMAGLAAVLAPFGPLAGSALQGGNRHRAPALRRLDSLIVLGPVWAAFASALK